MSTAMADKTTCAIDNSRLIDCCAVNFTKDDIGFTYAFAHRANLSGKPDAGKSYVVFGKIDSTAFTKDDIGFTYALFTVYNLSAIASGKAGFVINGENENDLSGRSVQIIQAIAVDIACGGG
jgi:hypothetical protein